MPLTDPPTKQAPPRTIDRTLFALAYVVVALIAATPIVLSGDWLRSEVVPLLIFAAIGARFQNESGKLSVSGEFIPITIAALLTPAAAPIVALGALMASDPTRRVKAIATSAIVAGAAVAGAVSTDMSATSFVDLLVTSMFAALAFLTTNGILIGIYLIYTKQVAGREFLASCGASIVASAVALSPIVALVTWISLQNPWVLPVVLAPLALTQYFLSLYHGKVELTSQLAEKAQVLARTNLQFAAAMVKALDQRDSYTAGHSAAVAVFTRDIARELGFDDEIIRLAHLSGLLHDIGKIGVPGRVLNKTAPLDDEEYELMKSHAAMGAEILGEVDLYSEIALLVRHHHERIDGRGYPDGLAGPAIPAISRMISVADTYSAMTTDRPYREGMSTERAMEILRDCRGTQLDSDFTDAFLRILAVADHAYRRGKQTDFEVEVAKHQALSEVEAESLRIGAPAPAGPARSAPAEPSGPPTVTMPLIPVEVEGEQRVVELEREAA